MKLKTPLGALAFVALISASGTARAQWAVFDGSALAQQLVHTAKTVQLVYNTYTQIDNQKRQIEYQLQSLKNIDPTTFSGLMSLLDQGKLTYAQIHGDLDSLGFSVQQINQDFDGLFPKDRSKWKSVKYSDYDNYYTRWNAEITASSKAADRAQASIAFVEKNNQQIASILSQAQGANGEVRQLQLINQQLALIHKELGAVVQNLATAGRVNSNMAASAAGEKFLEREAADRRLSGYTKLGRPAQTLKRLP
jgi:P-type conjugative transfer protein TrbJ